MEALLPAARQLDEIFKSWAEKGALGTIGEGVKKSIDEATEGFKQMQELTKQKPATWSDWARSGQGLPGFLFGGAEKKEAEAGPHEGAPAHEAAPVHEAPPALAPVAPPAPAKTDFWSRTHLPKFQEGGLVSQDQVAMLHKGELVIPADLMNVQRDAIKPAFGSDQDWINAIMGPAAASD
jgi:hypothetical protein